MSMIDKILTKKG